VTSANNLICTTCRWASVQNGPGFRSAGHVPVGACRCTNPFASPRLPGYCRLPPAPRPLSGMMQIWRTAKPNLHRIANKVRRLEYDFGGLSVSSKR